MALIEPTGVTCNSCPDSPSPLNCCGMIFAAHALAYSERLLEQRNGLLKLAQTPIHARQAVHCP